MRLDIKTETGWKNEVAQRVVEEIDEQWTKYEIKWFQETTIDAIRPIIAWYPENKGDVLEIRMPHSTLYRAYFPQ